MEAYFLFRRGGETTMPEVAVRDEQLEDIGSPSDSESPSTSRDSAAGSSSELDDDASSSSGSDIHGRSFEMASLMTQLPYKRGLSRFFEGKSQSFASLAAVGSLEDLAKQPARKRLKPSRSCGGGLDAHRGRLLSPRRHCPKATSAGARKMASRTGALAVLGAAPRRPPLAVPARPEGVAGKVLVVS